MVLKTHDYLEKIVRGRLVLLHVLKEQEKVGIYGVLDQLSPFLLVELHEQGLLQVVSLLTHKESALFGVEPLFFLLLRFNFVLLLALLF